MIEFILIFALVSFGVFVFGMMLNLRRLEIENRELRMQNTELYWKQVKP